MRLDSGLGVVKWGRILTLTVDQTPRSSPQSVISSTRTTLVFQRHLLLFSGQLLTGELRYAQTEVSVLVMIGRNFISREYPSLSMKISASNQHYTISFSDTALYDATKTTGGFHDRYHQIRALLAPSVQGHPMWRA
jgi:hypothetical protein